MEEVCAGESHWRAEDAGEVEKETRREEWELREIVMGEPFIGSGEGGREKGRGERELGSVIEEIERDRESRVRVPVWGWGREIRAEPRIVEEEKSRKRVRAMWVERGWEESVNEWGSIGDIFGGRRKKMKMGRFV